MNVTATALSLQELANLALGILTRDGVSEASVANTGHAGWRFAATGDNGTSIDIGIAGPDIPDRLNEEIISPPQVTEQMDWRGMYRLVVRAPLIVLDIWWTPGEPLRVMSFSRGDWENDLAGLAGPTA